MFIEHTANLNDNQSPTLLVSNIHVHHRCSGYLCSGIHGPEPTGPGSSGSVEENGGPWIPACISYHILLRIHKRKRSVKISGMKNVSSCEFLAFYPFRPLRKFLQIFRGLTLMTPLMFPSVGG